MLVTGATLHFANSVASGQLQEPPKFQKPKAFRYILGVRSDQSKSYGTKSYGTRPQSRNASTRNDSVASNRLAYPNSPSRYSAPEKRRANISDMGVEQIGLGNQPVGSGVKIVNRVVKNEQPKSVDPVNDPFGDLNPNTSSRAGSRWQNPQNNRSARQSRSRQNYAQPTSYSSPVQQESILRRPANSATQNRPTRNSSYGRTNDFSLEPPRRNFRQDNGRGAQPDSNPMTQTQRPMNGNQDQPMNQPMNQDPMNQDPMRQDPMNTIPMGNRGQDDFRQQKYELDCNQVRGVMMQKSVREIGLNLEPRVEEGKVLPPDCEFTGGTVVARCWTPQTFNWTASAACYKPLYFQHIQLERYGHTRGPIVQPVLSAAHFFGNAFVWPYKALFHPPNECVYPLGYYRPGDCAPWLREPWAWPSFDRFRNPAFLNRGRRF